MTFHDDMTIGEARALLRECADDGETCPVCTQFVKVYKRPLHSTMARYLISMHRRNGTGWVNVQDLAGKDSPDLVKLRYWGLLLPMPGEREDGSKRVGIWRVTAEGERFVLGEITVPKYARIYDGRLLNLTGPSITIRDALGKKFRYDELMAG